MSHSDGINPFLSLATDLVRLKDPCYCATVAIEFIISQNGEVSVKKNKEG